MANRKKINIALVSVAGGHFEQMINLGDFYSHYNHFWITGRMKQTVDQLKKERVYFLKAAHFKKPWTYLYHIGPVLKIYFKEKPTHVVSTGSGRIALIPLLLFRFLGVKCIFIDTFSRVHNHTMFATFLLKTGNKIYTQWQDSLNKNAVYIGPIFKQQENYYKRHGAKHIFVSVGSRHEPFTRLLKSVEELVRKGCIREKVIIQGGYTKYSSKYFEVFDFCTQDKINNFIADSIFVITQESAGIGSLCLKYKTKFIIMPRDFQYGELPSKSDMREDLHYELQELGYTKIVRNVKEMEDAIKNIDQLKVGFKFDNTLAIQALKKIIGKKEKQ